MEHNNQGDLADVVMRASGLGARPSSTHKLPIISNWQIQCEPTNFQPSLSCNTFCGEPLTEMLAMEFVGASASHFAHQDMVMESCAGIKAPCNYIFPQLLQISQAAVVGEVMDGTLMSCTTDGGGEAMQISSRPQTIKRKSQVKKVLCIPAPAAASGRPGGEVVPSDLWAWRKYGQKPIKGSPYPRGYYRCSSSKGCLARKQVERSRSDPNMLVITYTSEHNHPWPTQRNMLAGYARSQTSKKKNKNDGSSTSASKDASPDQKAPSDLDGESEEVLIANKIVDLTLPLGEEVKMDMAIDATGESELNDQAFRRSYNMPMISEPSQPNELFAELEELEPHPVRLYSKELMSATSSNEEKGNKTIDPIFDMFD